MQSNSAFRWFFHLRKKKEHTYKHTNIHTYIHSNYNSSVKIIDLVYHTTYVVCVNFTLKCRDLQFKVDSEWQIFWENFHGNFYCTLRESFYQKSAERKSPKKYLLYFILMSGLDLEPWLYVWHRISLYITVIGLYCVCLKLDSTCHNDGLKKSTPGILTCLGNKHSFKSSGFEAIQNFLMNFQ